MVGDGGYGAVASLVEILYEKVESVKKKRAGVGTQFVARHNQVNARQSSVNDVGIGDGWNWRMFLNMLGTKNKQEGGRRLGLTPEAVFTSVSTTITANNFPNIEFGDVLVVGWSCLPWLRWGFLLLWMFSTMLGTSKTYYLRIEWMFPDKVRKLPGKRQRLFQSVVVQEVKDGNGWD